MLAVRFNWTNCLIAVDRGIFIRVNGLALSFMSCFIGDYVLIVSDVTDPLPYPGSRLKPSFVQVKAIAHKRSRRETGPTLPTKEYSVPPSRLE
jgi:hypothetical protein